VPHAFTWRADPDSWRWRLELLEQLLACYQQALGHKLRNQLISLGGMANLLELQLADRLDAETRGYLGRLAAVARETGEVMRTLADIGRLCRDLEPSVAVDLTDAVREAATEVKVLVPHRPIEYDLQEKMPVVNVPRQPLHQALVYLLRLAGEPGGDGRPSAIGVTAETTVQGIALHVEAAGRSYSEEELALLFQRLSSGAVAADQGLDLFLVRQAAALWGGGVSVQSQPGRGTTFTLLFSNIIMG
jgi:signal transduction histidine kinase